MDQHRHGVPGQADHDPPTGRLAREDRLPRLDGDLVEDLPDAAGGKAIGHDVHVPHGYPAGDDEKVAGESLADLRRDGFPVVLYDSQVTDLPEAETVERGEEKMGVAVADHGAFGPLPRFDQFVAGRKDRDDRTLVDGDLPPADGGKRGDMM